jgi:hypothetical protein
MESMAELGSYRVEVSGWDTSENFFVEKTTLTWGLNAQKQILMKSDLREGCVLFIRLLQPTAIVSNTTIAYEVLGLDHRDLNGPTNVSVAQLRPRVLKEDGRQLAPQK